MTHLVDALRILGVHSQVTLAGRWATIEDERRSSADIVRYLRWQPIFTEYRAYLPLEIQVRLFQVAVSKGKVPLTTA